MTVRDITTGSEWADGNILYAADLNDTMSRRVNLIGSYYGGVSTTGSYAVASALLLGSIMTPANFVKNSVKIDLDLYSAENATDIYGYDMRLGISSSVSGVSIGSIWNAEGLDVLRKFESFHTVDNPSAAFKASGCGVFIYTHSARTDTTRQLLRGFVYSL